MNIADMVKEAVRKNREAVFSQNDQLSLGELIAKCQEAQVEGKDPEVAFDFEYAHPTGIDSWRGIYAELAIEFEFGGTEMKLSEFIALLESAVGKEFTGYKGGEFTMTRDTPMWVANYGNAGNTAVIGVIDAGWQIVIATGYREA